MNRPPKIIIAFLTISYLIPVVSGFCCCLEPSAAGSGSHVLPNERIGSTGQHSHSHNRHHDCGEHGGSHHSHNECHHAEIVAELAPVENVCSNETALISTRACKNIFVSKKLDSIDTVLASASRPLENSPPSGLFFSNPHFLGILRI